MFCPNCGTNNEDGAVFCGNCGTKLNLEDFNQAINEAANETTEAVNDDASQAADVAGQAADASVASEAATPNQGFVNNGFDQNANQNFNGFDQSANQNFNNGFNQNANQNFNNGFDPNANQNFNNGFNPNANQNYANNGYNQAPYQQQPPKPFKLNKKIVGIVAAVVAVIVAIVVFVNVGKAGVDYKKTAKNYVTAIEQCDWNKAYSLLDLPDSEFLTKDALINAHSDATGEKVTAISVKDSYTTASNLKGTESVTVTYSTATSTANTVNLTLSQTDDKYLLFFKKYKVSSEGLVYKDAEIRVPKGMTLTFNGIEVDSKYISDDYSSSSSTYDVYVIPYVFAGTNSIKVTSDFTEDYETTISVSYDEAYKYIDYSSLVVKDEAKKNLISKAESDIQTIAKAAYDNKSVDDLSEILSSDHSFETEFEDLKDDFHSTYKNVSSFEISAIKSSIENKYPSVNSEGLPKIRVYLGYTISGKYKTSYSDEEKNGTYTYSNYYYLDYVYENGEWVVDDASLNFYFY